MPAAANVGANAQPRLNAWSRWSQAPANSRPLTTIGAEKIGAPAPLYFGCAGCPTDAPPARLDGRLPVAVPAMRCPSHPGDEGRSGVVHSSAVRWIARIYGRLVSRPSAVALGDAGEHLLGTGAIQQGDDAPAEPGARHPACHRAGGRLGDEEVELRSRHAVVLGETAVAFGEQGAERVAVVAAKRLGG